LLAGPELDSSPDWGAYIQIFLLVSVRCPGSVALIIIVGLGYGRWFLVQGWPEAPSLSLPSVSFRSSLGECLVAGGRHRRRQLLIATSARRRCGAGSSPAALRWIVASCTRRGRHLSYGDGHWRSCAGVAAQFVADRWSCSDPGQFDTKFVSGNFTASFFWPQNLWCLPRKWKQ